MSWTIHSGNGLTVLTFGSLEEAVEKIREAILVVATDTVTQDDTGHIQTVRADHSPGQVLWVEHEGKAVTFNVWEHGGPFTAAQEKEVQTWIDTHYKGSADYDPDDGALTITFKSPQGLRTEHKYPDTLFRAKYYLAKRLGQPSA